MRKLFLPVLTMLLCLMLTMNVFAKTSNDVWMETELINNNGTELVVSVESNGKTTDGLLTITYNPEVLTCTEEDVQFSSSVDMHSVNLTDEGTIKVAYLAEQPVAEGTFITVNFAVKSEYSEGDVQLEGEAFDKDGTALTVGGFEEEPSEESTEVTTEPTDSSAAASTEAQSGEATSSTANDASTGSTDEDSTSETPSDQGGADTGDRGASGVIALIVLSCGVMLGLVAIGKSKVRH
ncbi:MAG: hypothetical protein ACLRZ7_07195 [Lachnospiraceae bacterium]